MQHENSSTTVETKSREHRANGEFKQWVTVPATLGHLHEVREIPRSDPPAYSAKISVPQGRGDYIKYVNLDLVVDSAAALALLLKYSEQINREGTKATLTFEYYNPYPDAYVLKNADGSPKRDDKGNLEIRAVIRGKLSRIAYLKIDKQVVFGKGKSSTVTPLSDQTAKKPAKSTRKTA